MIKKKHTSHPRNPFLGDFFFKGGLIESWERGTLKIISECKAAGLPQPETKVMSGGIAVTIFNDIYNEKHLQQYDLNERQLKAVMYVKENGEIVTSQYQERFTVTDCTALRDLTELVEKELLIKTGEKKALKYICQGSSVGKMADKCLTKYIKNWRS